MSYSTEGCQRSLFQQEVVTKCGCYDPAYPAPSNSSATMCAIPKDGGFRRVSDLKDVQSFAQNFKFFLQTFDSNALVACWSSIMDVAASDNGTCLEPCNEGVYEVARSASRWPRYV